VAPRSTGAPGLAQRLPTKSARIPARGTPRGQHPHAAGDGGGWITPLECFNCRRSCRCARIAPPPPPLSSDHRPGSVEPTETPHPPPLDSPLRNGRHLSQVLESAPCPSTHSMPGWSPYRYWCHFDHLGHSVRFRVAVPPRLGHPRLQTRTRSHLRQLPTLFDDRAGRGRQASARVGCKRSAFLHPSCHRLGVPVRA
jgi:hypothetical protein